MELVIEHIKNRLPKLGFSDFSWDVETIVLNELTPQKVMSLHNEILYVIPQATVEGMEIFSDTEYLKTDAITTAEPRTLIRPFTGNIVITIPLATRQVLVCIKVIPIL